MKRIYSILTIITIMTATVLSCEKDVGRTTDTEAVSMLLAAAEHDYSVESVGRILKSGSTDYNIIFGEHPVIDTYEDMYRKAYTGLL